MSAAVCPKCGHKPLLTVTDGPTLKPFKPGQKFWRQCVCGYDSRKADPTPDALKTILLDAMRKRGHLTLQEAWEIGHAAGFYTGGEAREVKVLLNRSATYHRGWWRAVYSDQKRRAKFYADYWTTARHDQSEGGR